MRLLAEGSGAQVYCVDYKLAPEYQWPVQIEEGEFVVRWLFEHAAERAIDPGIALGGDSAGGNMTCTIALKLRDEGGPKLALQMPLYPEAEMPFETRAGVENVSGGYVDTAGVRLSVWCLVPQGVDYSQPYITPLNAPSHAASPTLAKKLRAYLRASPGPAAWLHPDDGAFEAMSRSHAGAGGVARRRPVTGHLGLPAVAGQSSARVEHTSSPSRPLLDSPGSDTLDCLRARARVGRGAGAPGDSSASRRFQMRGGSRARADFRNPSRAEVLGPGNIVSAQGSSSPDPSLSKLQKQR